MALPGTIYHPVTVAKREVERKFWNGIGGKWWMSRYTMEFEHYYKQAETPESVSV